MYEKKIADLKDRLDRILSNNEKTIQCVIVEDFLEILGYKREWFKLEVNEYDSILYSDISVIVDRNPQNPFKVECKNGDKALNNRDIEQLSRYLNANNSKGEWGLLSNGNDFILYNNSIKGTIDERIVLEFNLKSLSNIEYINYFSYEFIYKRKVTSFFKYLKQFEILFKEKNKPSSFNVYKSSLINFFNYIVNIKNDNFTSLEHITIYDLYNWISYEIKNVNTKNYRIITSANQIDNKLRHINSFYNTLKENSIIAKNPFENLKLSDVLSFINFVDIEKKSKKIISVTEAYEMYNNQHLKRSNTRNELIILLLLYTGITKNELLNLKASQIDFEKKHLRFNDRCIPLDDIIIKKLKKYVNKAKINLLKDEYIFSSDYSEKNGDIFCNSFFNGILKESLDSKIFDDSRKKEIDIKFFRENFIRQLYSAGFWIEEIAYYTGLTIGQVSNYISSSQIEARVKSKKFLDKHPYFDLLYRITD